MGFRLTLNRLIIDTLSKSNPKVSALFAFAGADPCISPGLRTPKGQPPGGGAVILCRLPLCRAVFPLENLFPSPPPRRGSPSFANTFGVAGRVSRESRNMPLSQRLAKEATDPILLCKKRGEGKESADGKPRGDGSDDCVVYGAVRTRRRPMRFSLCIRPPSVA